MPTTRRRRTRKPKRPEVSQALFFYLTWGDYHAAREQQKRDGTNSWELVGGWPDYPSAWSMIESRAVEAWVQACPGSRPASWWKWSAREVRRLTGRYTLIKGLDRCHDTGIPHIDNGWQDHPPLVESTPALLDRLELWLPGERERVPAEAFAEQPFSYELTVAPQQFEDGDEEEDTLADSDVRAGRIVSKRRSA